MDSLNSQPDLTIEIDYSEVKTFVGSAQDFIAGYRKRLAENTDLDMTRFALASTLILEGEYSEGGKVAAQVAQAAPNSSESPATFTKETATAELLSAIERLRSIIGLVANNESEAAAVLGNLALMEEILRSL